MLPPSLNAMRPSASDLNPQERRFEVLIGAVGHVSSQIDALSLEQALIEIRANTAALATIEANLAAIQDNTLPFANLRFIYRRLRSAFRR